MAPGYRSQSHGPEAIHVCRRPAAASCSSGGRFPFDAAGGAVVPTATAFTEALVGASHGREVAGRLPHGTARTGVGLRAAKEPATRFQRRLGLGACLGARRLGFRCRFDGFGYCCLAGHVVCSLLVVTNPRWGTDNQCIGTCLEMQPKTQKPSSGHYSVVRGIILPPIEANATGWGGDPMCRRVGTWSRLCGQELADVGVGMGLHSTP